MAKDMDKSYTKQAGEYSEPAEMYDDKKSPKKKKDTKGKKKGGVETDYSKLQEKEAKKEIYSDDLSKDDEAKLIKQIEAEYQYARSYAEPELQENLRRLKLYNNQKRDASKVGDPLMFTIMQTVIAALYEDRMNVEFAAKELGDNDTSENLNELAEYDYEVMEKDIVDYEWIWDAAFFGRGFVILNTFDRSELTPMPEVMDPTTLLRDPKATSVNGDRTGRGSARFIGREITMTMDQMEDHPAFYNTNSIKYYDKAAQGTPEAGNFQSLLWEASEARAEAGNFQDAFGIYTEDNLGANREYQLLEWWTHFNGEKVLVTLACDRTKVVRYQILNEDHWPIFDRPLYPTAHDWKGVSIPDLVGDKQRLRAIIQNLMVDNMKSDLFPMYMFDSRRVKNKADLNFEFNKAIPIEGAVDGAIQPINKANPNSVVADYLLSTLDIAAQKATATPEVQQGVMPSQRRTLGELNMVEGNSSARYSLTARVFGWSEKRFWRQWYHLYKTNFDEYIDEKIIRLVGSSTPRIRTLTRENIISPIDPDVDIVSKMQSESERLQDLVRFEKYSQLIMADPTANSRFVLRHLGKLNGLPKDLLEVIFPPTIDELMAEDENRMLNENQLPEIKDSDNHAIHLELHLRASETPAKKAHIEGHKEALRLMKENPELFPNATQEELAMAQGGQVPIPGGEMGIPTPGQGAPSQVGIEPSQASAAPTGAMGA